MSKVVFSLAFATEKNPVTTLVTFKKKTCSAYLKTIAEEAEAIVREKHPEYGPLLDWSYWGHEEDIEIITDEPGYCPKCMNAFVEPTLEPDCDFSSRSIGEANPGYRMMLNTGARRKTHISLERWDESHKQWEIEGFYKPKFCPECGRKLIENEIGGIGIYIDHR
jgi:hypothetical protein